MSAFFLLNKKKGKEMTLREEMMMYAGLPIKVLNETPAHVEVPAHVVIKSDYVGNYFVDNKNIDIDIEKATKEDIFKFIENADSIEIDFDTDPPDEAKSFFDNENKIIAGGVLASDESFERTFSFDSKEDKKMVFSKLQELQPRAVVLFDDSGSIKEDN